MPTNGYVVSYGNRTGNDYEPGENAPIPLVPSSYHNQNFTGVFGMDVSADSDVDVRYFRLDQTDTEFAGQFFDVNFLGTDAISLAFNHQHPCWDRRLRTEMWYNRTRFADDTERANKRSATFPVISRVEAALENSQVPKTPGTMLITKP